MPSAPVEKKSSPYARRCRTEGERADVLARAARLRGEVERRRIVKAWLAEAIGRSLTHTLNALHGYRPIGPVLDRIEEVLAAVDAGQVEARVNASDPIPAIGGGTR